MLYINTLLDIIFPPSCLACGIKGYDLCLKCILEAPAAERETAEWIFPLYDYRHPSIKKALWLLKYKGRKRLANTFAEIIYEKIVEELSELSMMENFTQPLLIPIPLSKHRYRERGFNQAEIICAELEKIDARTNSPINFRLEKKTLIKPHETVHQAHIKDRRQRLKNMAGSFAINDLNKNRIKNKNIILIDDITTTGATLTEARKILKKAGAREIIAFTVAH